MKEKQLGIAVAVILLVGSSCTGEPSKNRDQNLHTDPSFYESGKVLFGFFPSPPEITMEKVLEHYVTLGKHADVILYQNQVPWEDFKDSPDSESQTISDMTNQLILARREGMEGLYVVDPLNGLNRREFQNLPPGWEPSFRNPDVRSAFRNFTLRILREFRPRYLGLASEINTYADAHPDDFPYFLSLYNEIYDAVKTESPDTQVFTTFQWEDLNNLWHQPFEEDFVPGKIKWEQIEVFEPRLDLWVISSYPYISSDQAAALPDDYYTVPLDRTDKPLAVAEGGCRSEDFLNLKGTEEDQVAYLNAIYSQIGERMAFWIYLLARDINVESYGQYIKGTDLDTLGFFATVGLITYEGHPKPALETWDSPRTGK